MRVILILIVMMSSTQAFAWHTSTGKVKNINFYSATDVILVSLIHSTTGEPVEGADVTACTNKTTFAISQSIPAERRSQMLSALLMAKASGRSVSFSYSSAGGCVPYGTGSSVYRGIVRLII
ncbi:hypothetical protein [Marinagarivorans algicola]|uniref:hypothetical protein n=1 Tax=Marinagarivorans algicola TaxID=1513270 RepID=UPI0006B8B04A|nr:hypothetical protein [Marinagarivorans algicola]